MKIFDRDMIIIFFAILAIVLILKLFNIIWHRKKTKNDGNDDRVLTRRIPSYSDYTNVSMESSSPNSPQRKTGNFYDYFLDHLETSKIVLENNILDAYGEDMYE